MKKVIAVDDNNKSNLTTAEAAQKKNLWITHHLEVTTLPITAVNFETSLEPSPGNIYQSGKRYYRINKSTPVFLCYICGQKGAYLIANLYYCKRHWKHLTVTSPIRRINIQEERNAKCACGSGFKFKNCCISKLDHDPRHYFNSEFMNDKKILDSLERYSAKKISVPIATQ